MIKTEGEFERRV
jgi:hypothetical protein